MQVLCRLENGGFGTGHNTVLSLLHSRVHFILNPDIQLTADTERPCGLDGGAPRVVMTRPGLTFPDGKPQQLPLRRCNVRAMVYRQLPCLRFWAKCNDRYLMADKDLTKPTEIEFCTGSFSAVDTAAFKAVGGFDEGYFMYVEDADLTQKMRTRGKAYLVPQYTAIHAWHRAAHRSLKPFFVAAAQPAALLFQVGLCVVNGEEKIVFLIRRKRCADGTPLSAVSASCILRAFIVK